VGFPWPILSQSWEGQSEVQKRCRRKVQNSLKGLRVRKGKCLKAEDRVEKTMEDKKGAPFVGAPFLIAMIIF
jgi:hypothetical protein